MCYPLIGWGLQPQVRLSDRVQGVAVSREPRSRRRDRHAWSQTDGGMGVVGLRERTTLDRRREENRFDVPTRSAGRRGDHRDRDAPFLNPLKVTTTPDAASDRPARAAQPFAITQAGLTSSSANCLPSRTTRRLATSMPSQSARRPATSAMRHCSGSRTTISTPSLVSIFIESKMGASSKSVRVG